VLRGDLLPCPLWVGVGNNNGIPVDVFIAFHQGLITEIDVSFSETYWDEMLPILDQKYGADWKVDRDNRQAAFHHRSMAGVSFAHARCRAWMQYDPHDR
jgi:hypothetical protein